MAERHDVDNPEQMTVSPDIQYILKQEDLTDTEEQSPSSVSLNLQSHFKRSTDEELLKSSKGEVEANTEQNNIKASGSRNMENLSTNDIHERKDIEIAGLAKSVPVIDIAELNIPSIQYRIAERLSKLNANNSFSDLFLNYTEGNGFTRKRGGVATHKRTSGEPRYACHLCDYRSSVKSNLNAHLRTHTGEKPFVCNVCDYKFTQAINLRKHLRIHTGEKPFACTMCDYKFSQAIHLQKHIRTHTGEKPYECNVCNQKFSHQSNLQRHERSHTGEKPFACDICDYKCSAKCHLQRHMRTHTGEKPFACNYCNYKSSDKRNLQGHIRIHTGEKPYKCSVCGFRFTNKSDLTRHGKTIHRELNTQQPSLNNASPSLTACSQLLPSFSSQSEPE